MGNRRLSQLVAAGLFGISAVLAILGLALVSQVVQAHPPAACPPPPVCPPDGFALVPLESPADAAPPSEALLAIEQAEQALQGE